MTRPTDRLAAGLIAAVDRFFTIARPNEDWEPSPADLLSIVAAFLKAAGEAEGEVG